MKNLTIQVNFTFNTLPPFFLKYLGKVRQNMASITYGWNLETILRVHGIENNFSALKQDRIQEYNQNLKASLALLQPILKKYDGVNIWLMCLQDSEINLMESKMVGISTMIGGYVPELFWSLVPNEAVNDNLPSKNFESLIKFFLDMKENGIEIPPPTVHFSGWHAEPINLSE